jgi:hypothetical protein
MKRKDLVLLGGVALVAAFVSFLLSDALIGSPKKHPIKVPVVQQISSDFPDVQNDPNYKQFLNNKALNPTQLIHIGNNKNTKPFQVSNQ